MIGNSKFEYFYILFFIVTLHLVAPVCLVYCISLILLFGPTTIFTSPFSLYTLAESLFFISYFPCRRYLQRRTATLPVTDPKKRRELFNLCMQNIPDPESYLRQWFLGADISEIKRENLKEFMLWAFFNHGGPPGDDSKELDMYVDQFEALLGRTVEDGRGNAVALRVSVDKFNMLHRSILWYFCVGFVDSLTHIIMHYHGFHFYRVDYNRFFFTFPFRPLTLLSTLKSPVKNTAYWYREHKSKSFLPVVFLHGIGIGLYPYTPFFRELNSFEKTGFSRTDNQIGILAIESLHISFRLTSMPGSNEEFCSRIEQILLNHFSPNQKFVFVAHSFGTNDVSILLKNPSTAKYIKSIVLIDPIPILLHLPNVAYNFTRKTPSKASEFQLYYFAAMDIGIALTLGRHFLWSDAILWKETLGNRNVTVILAGRDLIVDTEAVGRYLSTGYTSDYSTSDLDNEYATPEEKGYLDRVTSIGQGSRVQKDKVKGRVHLELSNDEWKFRSWRGSGIDILWYEDLDHAQVFDKHTTRRCLASVIRTYCREGCLAR